MTDVRDAGPTPVRSILLFATIGVLMAIDVADDLRVGTDAWHLALELAVIVLAVVGTVALWRSALAAHAEAARLGDDLDAARADAARWRDDAREALAGLGAAIGRQFERWELTEAEHRIGLLLLKGMSHKEVAAARVTSERTVRQQALAIYRKAGVHSRAELAAFFLRELPSVP